MIVRRRESVERAVSPVRSADQRRAALLDLTRDSPDELPNRREYWCFSGLPARQTQGADGYRHLAQPERWSWA